MHYELNPIRFPARDIAAITGVSEQSQRNWRARGFLPAMEGGKHFRADVFDLAVLMVANLIADRLPVERAVDFATICGRGVAHMALESAEAWAGDTDAVFSANRSNSAVKAAMARYGNIARVVPAPYFILWADGSEVWHVNLDWAFSKASAEQRTGSILILDLAALAASLIERRAPFVMVKQVA